MHWIITWLGDFFCLETGAKIFYAKCPTGRVCVYQTVTSVHDNDDILLNEFKNVQHARENINLMCQQLNIGYDLKDLIKIHGE